MSSILKISDAASLALHAMVILSKTKNELVSVKSMASTLDVSINHLSKVMQKLVKANLATSIKGYNGGFKLSKNPKDITFLNIYEALEGQFEPVNCLLGRKACSPDVCIMGDLLSVLNTETKYFFKKTTMANFIE